jgi:hypothetical protein
LTINALDLDLASSVMTSSFTSVIIGGARKRAVATIAVSASVSATITHTIGVSNIGTRTFLSNQQNGIFDYPGLTPIVSDPFDPTYEVTITVSSGQLDFRDVNAQGSFPATRPAPVYTSLTYTGKKEVINGWQTQDVRYYPDYNSTSNATYTYTLRREGVQIYNRTFALNYAGAGSVATQIYSFSTPGAAQWKPTKEQYLYKPTISYLYAGGGGGGGYPGGRGGGSGAQVIETLDTAWNGDEIQFTVASGGNLNANGGNTTAMFFRVNATTSMVETIAFTTAVGGNTAGGTAPYGGGVSGGNHPTRTSNTGGIGWPLVSGQATRAGGGGAGAREIYGQGAGGNAQLYTGIYSAGLGGIGFVSTITGTSVTYAAGGKGGDSNDTAFYQAPANGTAKGGKGGGSTVNGVNFGTATKGGTGVFIIKI